MTRGVGNARYREAMSKHCDGCGAKPQQQCMRPDGTDAIGPCSERFSLSPGLQTIADAHQSKKARGSKPPSQELSQNLRRAREQMGISLAGMAHWTGLSSAEVSAIELGRFENPALAKRMWEVIDAEAKRAAAKTVLRGKFDGINEGKARARAADQGRKRTSAETRLLDHLHKLHLAGEILCFMEQPVSLRLANRTHYQPDFLSVGSTGLLTYWEAKGEAGWGLDAKGRVKFKAAAEQHRYACFTSAIWMGKRFEFETYKPDGMWPPVGGVL